MNEPNEGKKESKLYTPQEVADMFGITPDSLRQYRRRGRIEGIVFAKNYVMYTEEQIKKADLSPKKRGPKPKKQTSNQPKEKNVA